MLVALQVGAGSEFMFLGALGWLDKLLFATPGVYPATGAVDAMLHMHFSKDRAAITWPGVVSLSYTGEMTADDIEQWWSRRGNWRPDNGDALRVALCKALVACLSDLDADGHRPWFQKLLKCSRNIPARCSAILRYVGRRSSNAS